MKYHEYNLEVVELKRIGPDDIGCSIKQLEPWVHHEISSEYDLKVLHLERIGSDEVGIQTLPNLHKIPQNMQIRQSLDPEISKLVRDNPLTPYIAVNRRSRRMQQE